MAKRGPKSDKYADIIIPNLQKIEGMFCAGATREDVAQELKISVSMFYEYQKRPELMEAIKNGERGATGNVVAALYKKATRGGQDHMGDTTAQIFWLKNKAPNEWRDKRDIEANVNLSPAEMFAKALSGTETEGE